MIHVFVGTKAQFIKMAPIMQEMDRRSIAYNFIDAGQHAGITEGLRSEFGLREPDVHLREEDSNISTVRQAIIWALTSIGRLTFRRSRVWRQVFREEDGICLIHGDTLTTLLSLIYAKRCGIAVAHVEAGLRSYHLFDPFPEEIIRLLAMRFSDVLFAPSRWAHDNLRDMGYAAKTIDAGGNTIIDTLRFVRQKHGQDIRPASPYIVATTHRVENIYSRKRLTMISKLLQRLANEYQVLFVLHEPTREQLRKYDLYAVLDEHPDIQMLPLQPYLAFIQLLAGSEFIVTDGGSIQEESYVLDVPCLIMRSKTERQEGLGENAYVADFDEARIEQFLKRLPQHGRRQDITDQRPASVVVDHVQKWADRRPDLVYSRLRYE